MNRRELVASIVAGSTIPLTARGAAGDDLTPITEMPDYCAVAETREEAVQVWASEHVQNARVELIGNGDTDVAEVKAELETALELLERELPDA
ncbi:hypothetical protein EXE43_23095 [Halorubrum sp. SS5]|uniref:hypothetical protein n=1 Tax=unclassified Halorubrum TaxID=2642239 RepID=UPI0010FA33D8|nr:MULTISPECIES: hypothetical protein [unclassified Halorubrum]TKX53029.1 hypothetical protein EXE42_14485 [Halorubrum sp. SP3]TKX55105.1 hypothetical protein EXE44_16510 [Halorubrum sp. SS7]TKX60767.1 hypothetical protein EXE45_17390 [Halorubrum sp. SP9]TKX83658.1 hypothetical protein EXE43_23095 [Halorubrum sp. SS5]